MSLRLSTTVVQCKEVVILPNKFNSNLAVAGKMYVVTTINYFNSSTGFVHDAAVSWTESISTSGFTVCALKAGRNDRTTPDSGLTFIDYFIFQGAPTGTVTGRKKISDWWEGTTCKTVDLPLVCSTALLLLHRVIGNYFKKKLSCPSCFCALCLGFNFLLLVDLNG